MLYGTEVVYAHTSKEDEAHLLTLVEALATARGDQKSEGGKKPGSVKTLAGQPLENRHVISQDPRRVGQEKKLDLLRRADAAARAASSQVAQVNVRAADQVSDILICNSEGLWITDRRTRARFHVSVTAKDNGEIFTANEAPGAQRGFEFFESLDIESFAQVAAMRATLMLKAGYIQGRRMPVVMGNGFGGVIFHEACGHLLETEAIRRKASAFADRLGQQIAHSAVTAVDDGTFANVWGSINVDDEGRLPERTVLIQNGVLQTYLSDRVGAAETGVALSGSARRESYQYAPVSRMRNTYIDKGTDTVDQMIGSVDDGLFAKKMGGGSVNPATGEFNFAVEEGYRIRNGKLAEPVRGATLIGKGPEILPLISMVGDDLELAAGMCGASSGHIPVTVGQPTIKVDSILVGGR
jgi:TldD protein